MSRSNRLQQGLTLIELVVAVALIATLTAIALPALTLAAEADARMLCLQNLKQWGLVFKMYSGEHNGMFPGMSRRGPHLYMPDAKQVFPKYIDDVKLWVCPSDSSATPDQMQERYDNPTKAFPGAPGGNALPPYPGNVPAVGAPPWQNSTDPDEIRECLLGYSISYVYRPWVITNRNELAGWQQSYGTWYGSFATKYGTTWYADNSGDITIPTTKCGTTLPTGQVVVGTGGAGCMVLALREGVERFLITDINDPGAAAKAMCIIPVMWDVASGVSAASILMGTPVPPISPEFNHVPNGGNILYLDGHVEFIEYPGKFPYDTATYVGANPAMGGTTL